MRRKQPFGPRDALASAMLLVLAMSVAFGQTPRHQVVMLPMADGVKLSTDISLPDGPGPFPVVLVRSTYGKGMISPLVGGGTGRGYAIVIQDTRGRGGSEGENLPFIGDGWWNGHQDGNDTLQWVLKQPWCNGKVGTFGPSALGITQLGLAGTGAPGLTTQHIMIASPSMYQFAAFPGGVFKKAMIEDWLRSTKHDPQGLQTWLQHPDYDSYWTDRELSNRWGKVNWPAIHIGGWFDIFGQGTIESFMGYQYKGGPFARGKQKLVMGPWTHGLPSAKAGDLRFPGGGLPPGHITDPWKWFDATLKGESNGFADLPAVTYYVMGDSEDPGAPGDEWRTAKEWPIPSTPTKMFFQQDKSLSNADATADTTLSYDYDPKNPVPTNGGPELTIPGGPRDQTQIEARPDVLTFTTAPLTSPIEVTGRVRAHLYISSDAPDTDFVVHLCDVHPDGKSFNISEGVIRARFYAGFENEHLLQKGRTYLLNVDLWSTSMIFNKGHKIRVDVTSSSYPAYDPNPNTGAAFRTGTTTRVAHNSIHIGGPKASFILLPVVTTKSASAAR